MSLPEEGDASSDPDLTCPICLDVLFEPLTLRCGHSFCRACLLGSTKLAPDGRCCPQCRRAAQSASAWASIGETLD